MKYLCYSPIGDAWIAQLELKIKYINCKENLVLYCHSVVNRSKTAALESYDEEVILNTVFNHLFPEVIITSDKAKTHLES